MENAVGNGVWLKLLQPGAQLNGAPSITAQLLAFRSLLEKRDQRRPFAL